MTGQFADLAAELPLASARLHAANARRPWTALLLAASFLVSNPAAARPLHIGSINAGEPATEVTRFASFAAYLARELRSEGIDAGRVVVAPSIPKMADLLRQGQADLFIDSPFPSLVVSRLCGSKFLLRRWKNGIGEYKSVVFVRKDGGIARLADLKGKLIALQESYSTSGYFLPKMALRREGLMPVPRSGVGNAVAADEVGYVLNQDDESAMLWVLRRRVAAAATDDQSFVKTARDNRASLEIVHETPPLPRQIVSYRADLPAGLLARIKAVLLSMHQSEEGRNVLFQFEKTTLFDELPEDGLARLRELQKGIDSELAGK